MTGIVVRISLCTTCHNRCYQLRKVFGENIEVIRNSKEVEWVILNCGSQDDLHSFMIDRIPNCNSRITYAREISGRSWHVSLSKNIAHKMGSGDILMNLDCDNRIGQAITDIRLHMNENVGAMHLCSGKKGDGTHGRIAIHRNLFYEIGGYDESLLPMGYQDSDLLARVEHRALVLTVPCGSKISVVNSKQDSVRHCRIDKMNWKTMKNINRQTCQRRYMAGQFVANNASRWGQADLEYFTRSIYSYEESVPWSTEEINSRMIRKRNTIPTTPLE
jgi:hypothetical protein